MKHLLLTTIAAVLVVGCGESQQSVPQAESEPVESVAEVPAKPSNSEADRALLKAAKEGNIEAVKQHLAAGTDVNAFDRRGWTPLHYVAAYSGHKEIAELLIAKGADVNAMRDGGVTPLNNAALGDHKEIAELLIAEGADVDAKKLDGDTPLDWAVDWERTETANLLRKHGGKTGEELKAADK